MGLYNLGDPLGSFLVAYRDIVALQEQDRQRREAAELRDAQDVAGKYLSLYTTTDPAGNLVTKDAREALRSPEALELFNHPFFQGQLKHGVPGNVAKVRVDEVVPTGKDDRGNPHYGLRVSWLDEDGNVLSHGPVTEGRTSRDDDPVKLVNADTLHHAVMSSLYAKDRGLADYVRQQLDAAKFNRVLGMIQGAKTPEERETLLNLAVRNGMSKAALIKDLALPQTRLSANGVQISVDPYGNEAFAGVSPGLQAANRNALYQDAMVRAQAAEDADRRFAASALERRLAQDRARYEQKRGLRLRDAFDIERMLDAGSGASVPASAPAAPSDAEAVIRQAAIDNNLDPALLKAVGLVESGLNPAAVSPKGARGAFQLMPATAAQYGVTDPHDLKQAANGAARYLRDLTDLFGGDTEKALTAYNLGPGALMKALRSGEPLPKEGHGRYTTAAGLPLSTRRHPKPPHPHGCSIEEQPRQRGRSRRKPAPRHPARQEGLASGLDRLLHRRCHQYWIFSLGDGRVHEHAIAAEFHRYGGVGSRTHARVDQDRDLGVFHDGQDVVGIANPQPRSDGGGQRHHGDAADLFQALGDDRIVVGVYHDIESIAHQDLRRLQRRGHVREEGGRVAQHFQLDQTMPPEQLAGQPAGTHGVFDRVTAGGIGQNGVAVGRDHVQETGLARVLADVGAPDRHRDDLRTGHFHRGPGFRQILVFASPDQQA